MKCHMCYKIRDDVIAGFIPVEKKKQNKKIGKGRWCVIECSPRFLSIQLNGLRYRRISFIRSVYYIKKYRCDILPQCLTLLDFIFTRTLKLFVCFFHPEYRA